MRLTKVIRSPKSLLILSSLMLSLQASALQILDVSEGQTIFAKISLKEPSRIAIEGGRIKRIFGADGELAVEPDKATGQIFVTPSLPSGKPINLFVVSETGTTYTLLLQPIDLPSEVLILKEKIKKSELSQLERSGSYERMVKSLVYSMANDQVPDDVQVQDIRREIPLWKEAKLTLLKRYEGTQVVGEKYDLTNSSQAEMVIAEQELFRDGVKGISIQNRILKAGESTPVYVVRTKRENE